MKRSPLFVAFVVSVTLLMLTFVTGTVAAQDPVKVAPKNYKVLLDNEHVRVLEFNSKAGVKIGMHSHPAYVVYAISGGKSKSTAPDGKTTEREAKAGSATWNDAETHTSEAMGPGDAHAIIVEMKGHPAAAKKEPAKKAPAKK